MMIKYVNKSFLLNIICRGAVFFIINNISLGNSHQKYGFQKLIFHFMETDRVVLMSFILQP